MEEERGSVARISGCIGDSDALTLVTRSYASYSDAWSKTFIIEVRTSFIFLYVLTQVSVPLCGENNSTVYVTRLFLLKRKYE